MLEMLSYVQLSPYYFAAKSKANNYFIWAKSLRHFDSSRIELALKLNKNNT